MKKFPVYFQKTSDAANIAVLDGTIYEFADFRLIPEDNLLLRSGESIPLAPKAFSTLVLLIQRHGHLVRKEELIERIWNDSFVEEAAVSRCVWTIRNALGEDSKNQRYIQTVPKQGYKFVADVTVRRGPTIPPPEVNGNGSASVVEATLGVVASKELSVTSVETSISRPDHVHDGQSKTLEWYQRRPVALAAGLVVLVGLIIISASFLSTSRSSPARHPIKFAVLPLKPIDAANRSDLYEIGVAEGLIHRLNSIKGFAVRPLSATRKYEAIDQDAVAAGREQKVDYVLGSNYQIADGKMRITAQLYNVASGQLEESHKFETAAVDVFAIQDAVASEIGNRLVARFGGVTGPAQRRGTSNEEAYSLYLQAKYLTMRRHREPAKKAVEYLEEAIRLDPNFALAYAQLAQVYRKADESEQERDKVRGFVNKALELDPYLAEAYVARADNFMLDAWDLVAAERDLAKALELDPNNDTARWLNAKLLANRGRLDEALAEIEAARAIDPGAVMYMFHHGRILYYARRYDEAMEQYRRAIDLDDRFVQPHGWMLRAYEMKGDHANALESYVKREERLGRMDPERLAGYQKAFETAGWMGVRMKRLQFFEGDLFDIARLHAMQGEKDKAFEFLNKAVEKHEWLILTLKVEPALDGLRDDPRFDELLKNVRFD